MALRELVEGDCGAANPLVQWSSHFHQHKPLPQGDIQHDRLQDIARRHDAEQLEKELVSEFLGESRPAVPQMFNMASLLAEIQQAPPITTPSQLTQHTQHDSSVREWVNEFAPAPPTSTTSSLTHHTSQAEAAGWAHEFSSSHADKQAHDWSQQFAPAEDEKWAEEFRDEMESKGLAAVATEISETVTDPKIQATEFMDFVRKLGKGETAVGGAEAKGQSSDSVWVSEFTGKEEEVEVEEMGYWGQLEKEWQDLAKQNTHPWLDDLAPQETTEYQFQSDNHLKDMENALEEGMKRLQEGDLPSAVLLFEAEVQRRPDSIEGWQYLGTTQANNEQETAAIAALQRCLELCPSNLTAHLTLAVSYTNESQQRRALESLKNWLHHNPKYSSLVPQATVAQGKPYVPSLMSSREHREVCDLFLRAAQLAPEILDPDIQVCLGILYNLSSEFDKAVDCFTAALQAKPDDAMLWNKLGATLANSNRSEEAVHAYRQALSHTPGFTRCRYNLGISCINLKAYREAVEHFLTALCHQKQARGPSISEVGGVSQMSEAIWSTLRLAITFLGRPDLIPSVEGHKLDVLLEEFGLG